MSRSAMCLAQFYLNTVTVCKTCFANVMTTTIRDVGNLICSGSLDLLSAPVELCLYQRFRGTNVRIEMRGLISWYKCSSVRIEMHGLTGYMKWQFKSVKQVYTQLHCCSSVDSCFVKTDRRNAVSRLFCNFVLPSPEIIFHPMRARRISGNADTIVIHREGGQRPVLL